MKWRYNENNEDDNDNDDDDDSDADNVDDENGDDAGDDENLFLQPASSDDRQARVDAAQSRRRRHHHSLSCHHRIVSVSLSKDSPVIGSILCKLNHWVIELVQAHLMVMVMEASRENMYVDTNPRIIYISQS